MIVRPPPLIPDENNWEDLGMADSSLTAPVAELGKRVSEAAAHPPKLEGSHGIDTTWSPGQDIERLLAGNGAIIGRAISRAHQAGESGSLFCLGVLYHAQLQRQLQRQLRAAATSQSADPPATQRTPQGPRLPGSQAARSAPGPVL
ncbi:hypothetical protein PG997_007716 [Apiospora hydei]|uniref:Uncharacterized protein n=1 Tax=Apiospora hydei TaxID=1337664 RepID=A0ABR1W8T7_9PEZI